METSTHTHKAHGQHEERFIDTIDSVDFAMLTQNNLSASSIEMFVSSYVLILTQI